MRWHVLIWLLAAMLLSGRADSRGIGNSYMGIEGSGSAAAAACGTGVINFSTGCVQPMFGGL
jgi:hypothetical protein